MRDAKWVPIEEKIGCLIHNYSSSLVLCGEGNFAQ